MIGKRLGEKVNLSPRHFILCVTLLVGISLSVFSASALDEYTAIGEYINPLNSDDCLEINRDGTCYIETHGLNQGTTGQWKLDNKRISLLFPYGETYRGMVKTDAILLEESGLAPVVWIKPTKSPPRLRDVAGRYVKEGHPEEYLLLNANATYTQIERGMTNDLFTMSGKWELDGHVVTLFYLGFGPPGISVAVLGGCLYSTGLFGADIWIGELLEEPAPEEVSPAEAFPEEEEERLPSGKQLAVEWERVFGISQEDFGVTAQQTDDGGYIILGNTTSEIDGYDISVIWLIKTDPFGIKQWEQTFGGEAEGCEGHGYSVQQTSDGGYVIVGTATSNQRDVIWLIKTDPFGIKQWQQTFGGEAEGCEGYGYSVQQTSDGGYIIVGEINLFTETYDDIWLIKTDNSGTVEWENTFGGPSRDWGLSVRQTTDNGYIIGGITFRGSGWDIHDDIWLIKTDHLGNWEWDKRFGGESTESIGNVQQTEDGGYVVVGTTKLPNEPFHLWLIKTDSSGDEEWDRTFERVIERAPACIQQTDDGGYIIGTTSEDYISGEIVTVLWLLKTDSLGEEEWKTTLAEDTTGACVQQTTDGGYIIIGTKLTSDSEKDIWLVKLMEDGAAPREEELSCKIELRKEDGSTSIDTINVNESLDIYVEALSGEPYQVRFSSDEDQDSVATGGWTKWFEWDKSSGDWDAAAKTMAWTFTTSGKKEVCVEIRDGNSSGTTCFATTDTSGSHDNPTITQLRGLIDDLIEDYRNRLNDIKGYTLSNAESFAYFDNCVSKDEIDIKVDLAATLFSLALSGMTSTAEYIHYKHTSVLSVIEEIAWETRHADAYALLESIGGIDNIVKALTELTTASLQIVAGEALKEFSYQLTSNKLAFSKKLIDHLGQQIDKDQEQLESLAEEVKLGLWSLTPEEAEQYIVELRALKSGNLFLFDNYSRKSILTETIAEIRKIDEEDWRLKLADFLWGTSVGLLKVSAHLATGGFLLPATITAIDAAREQFFENSQKLSVDAQLRGLAIETLSEGFTVGGTIYSNTQQALKDIRDRNHLCIPQGSISVENKRIRRIFESDIANTTPITRYLVEEEVSDVYVTKDEQCGEETKYSLSVFYKAPYTSFRLFPGVEVTYEDLLPVQKTSEVHDGSVRFQYDVSPEGSDLTFYLFGESEDRLYGLQDLSIKEWDPIEVVVKESRDYLGRFVSSAIEEQNYEALSMYYDNDTDRLIYRPTEVARIKSPGELRMYDSQGRVTGLVDGRIREEIPGAVYDDANKLVITPTATGSYHYEIAGTKRGTYELEVISIDSGEIANFSAVSMPTAAGTVHQYTIDWDALARGEQGASLEVDSEGDGSFETIFSAQDKFDGNSVPPTELANPKGGTLLWLWIILGVVAASIVTIAMMISMKRKSSWITLSN